MSEFEPKNIVDRGKKARDAAPIQRLIAGFVSEPHRPDVVLETTDFETFRQAQELPPYDGGMDSEGCYHDPSLRLERPRDVDL